MAVTPKILSQTVPLATTLTDSYTVPAATAATVSTVLVCNRGGTDATFRLSLAVAGAVDATKQYAYYDTPVRANSSFAATLGITLGAADVVRVYASNTSLSFSVLGVEVS